MDEIDKRLLVPRLLAGLELRHDLHIHRGHRTELDLWHASTGIRSRGEFFLLNRRGWLGCWDGRWRCLGLGGFWLTGKHCFLPCHIVVHPLLVRLLYCP